MNRFIMTRLEKIFALSLIVACFALASMDSRAQGSAFSADPCLNQLATKQSAIINITSATTTQLVAAGTGSQIIYVCGFALTISQVVTTANTLKFIHGSGASCGTGTADLTGALGAGGVTAAPPLVVVSDGAGTMFKTAPGNALCATTTIGASASFVGVVSFVQQ